MRALASFLAATASLLVGAIVPDLLPSDPDARLFVVRFAIALAVLLYALAVVFLGLEHGWWKRLLEWTSRNLWWRFGWRAPVVPILEPMTAAPRLAPEKPEPVVASVGLEQPPLLQQVILLSEALKKAEGGYAAFVQLLRPNSRIEGMRGFEITNALERAQREVTDAVKVAEHDDLFPPRTAQRAQFQELIAVARGGFQYGDPKDPRFKFEENKPFLAAAEYNRLILAREVEKVKETLKRRERTLDYRDKLLLKAARKNGDA